MSKKEEIREPVFTTHALIRGLADPDRWCGGGDMSRCALQAAFNARSNNNCGVGFLLSVSPGMDNCSVLQKECIYAWQLTSSFLTKRRSSSRSCKEDANPSMDKMYFSIALDPLARF
jgi:hypothetical protein